MEQANSLPLGSQDDMVKRMVEPVSVLLLRML